MLFEEGQSRRRVVVGPATSVVVTAVAVEAEVIKAVDCISLPVEAEVAVGISTERLEVTDALLLFADSLPPTTPPAAAPITSIEPMIAIIQNAFGARPHIRLRGCVCISGCDCSRAS